MAEMEKPKIDGLDGKDILSILLDISHSAVIAIDQDQKILLFNQGARRIFGYEPSEVLGEPLDIVIPRDKQEIHREHVRRFGASPTLAKLMDERQEIRGQRKDGALFPASASIAKTTSGGRLVFLVIVQDISAQKAAEEKIRQNETDLAEAQRLARLGNWVFDAATGKVNWSDELFRIFEIERSEFLEKYESFVDFVVPEDKPKVIEANRRARQDSLPFELEYRILTKTGHQKTIRELGYAVKNEDGQVIRLFGTAQDVTERKKDEERLKTQLRRMEALHAIEMVITSSFEVQLTLDIVIKTAVTQLGVDAAAILLYRPDSHQLEFAGWQGYRTPKLERIQLKLGEGLAGKAILDRKKFFVTDLANEADEYVHKTLYLEEGFVSYFGVPLLSRGEAKGVLEILHRSPLQPDEDWLAFLDMLSEQAAIAIDNAQLFEGVNKSNLKLAMAYDATIEGWSRAMDLRDKETEGHTQRVTEMTIRLARAMGLGDKEISHIRRGALLHDMGKLGVPDDILFKPDKLNDAEWAIMRQHPQYAYDMLCSIDYLKPALDIPYSHHEKWDGTGYPQGLKGEQIPLAARLFAIVDVWDALQSDRPYRAGWPKEKVLDHIRSLSGTHFDPQVVELFLRVMQEEDQADNL